MGVLETRLAKCLQMHPDAVLTLDNIKGAVEIACRSKEAIMNFLQLCYDKCFYSGPIVWPE